MSGRIHKEPFAQIPEWLLDAEVSDRAIRTFAVLDRHADREGRAFPGRPKLAERLGCSTSSLDRALDELREAGALTTVERRREDGSRSSNDYWLWPAAHPGASPVRRPLPTREEGGLPTTGEGASPPVKRQEREPDEREPELTPATRDALPSPPLEQLFGEFWEAYPRKTSKGAARSAYHRATRKAQPSALLIAAQRYAADPNREDRYTKHPATWLNAECWTDPPLPARARPAGRVERSTSNLERIQRTLLGDEQKGIGA